MILMDYSRKQGIKMVSHETIYQHIWWDKAHGGGLYKHLRHRGRRHKKRGANENTNGLIRQYIPKGSDFTNITQEFLEEVERKLNERPRKRHGFLSPNQVFSKSTGLDARLFV